MEEDMRALEKNHTWEIRDLPKGKKAVECNWVFTVKHKFDGFVEKYKARLIAKGYTYTYGIDYQEIFSPIFKMNSIRVLISLTAWALKKIRWEVCLLTWVS